MRQKLKVVVGKLIRKLQLKPSWWDRNFVVHIWNFVVVVSAVAIVAVVADVAEAATVVVEDIVVEESAENRILFLSLRFI